MTHSLKQQIEYLFNFLTSSRKNRFLNIVKIRTRFIAVVLEDIYDPHNGSACLRSCDANGIQDVYVIERNHPFSTKEGVSMGSGKWLSIYKFNSKVQDPTIECFNTLKRKGYKIYGMHIQTVPGKNNYVLNEVLIDQPSAFVFGSEKNGLSTIAMNSLENFVQIPMYGFVESYNISVACALTVFTLIQKLRNTSILWQLTEEEQCTILLEWLKKDISNSELLLKKFFIDRDKK